MCCFLKASPIYFEDENPSLYFEKTLLEKKYFSRGGLSMESIYTSRIVFLINLFPNFSLEKDLKST